MKVATVLAISLLMLVGCAGPHDRRPHQTTTSPPDRPGGPFYGLDVPHADIDTAGTFDDALGFRATVLSVFIRLDTTNTRQKMDSIVAAGYTPFVTLEPWHSGFVSGSSDPNDALSHLVAGQFDAQITRQAQALATIPGPFYLRFGHEMNAPWYPWGDARNTAAEYVAAWKHVHALVDAVVGHRALWVWSPAQVGLPSVSDDLAQFYPGPDEVDFFGLTAYEHVSADPAVTFGPSLTALAKVGDKPVLLAEIGSDSPRRAAWLTALGPYLLHHPTIRGLVYFNTSPLTTGATGDYELNSLSTIAAFASTLNRIGAARI